MSKRGPIKYIDDSSDDEPEPEPVAGPSQDTRGRSSSTTSTSSVQMPAWVNAQQPQEIPVPPPLPRGAPAGPFMHRPALPPYQTFDEQLDDKLGRRGVWDEKTKSYLYTLPTVARTDKFAGAGGFPRVSTCQQSMSSNQRIFSLLMNSNVR